MKKYFVWIFLVALVIYFLGRYNQCTADYKKIDKLEKEVSNFMTKGRDTVYITKIYTDTIKVPFTIVKKEIITKQVRYDSISIKEIPKEIIKYVNNDSILTKSKYKIDIDSSDYRVRGDIYITGNLDSMNMYVTKKFKDKIITQDPIVIKEKVTKDWLLGVQTGYIRDFQYGVQLGYKNYSITGLKSKSNIGVLIGVHIKF